MADAIVFRQIDPQNQQEMERALRFRYEIVFEELACSGAQSAKEGLERDVFDAYAKHYGAYTKDRLIAYVRFIYHSPVGYPATNHLRMPPDVLSLPQEQVGEISRIFIRKEYRRYGTTRTILQRFMKDFIYPEAKRAGIRYCYGALQEEFLKLLNRFKIPYKAVTPLQEYQHYGGMRYGALLDLKEYERLWGLGE